MKISKRGTFISASPIRRLIPFANAAEERGIKVYHLNIGQPDIPTPLPIFNGIKQFDKKVLPYGPSEGLKELRKAIANYLKEDYLIEVSPNDVFITTGGSEAIIFAMEAIADPEDEIIVFEPFYTNYNGFASMASVKLAPVTLSVKNGFHLPPKKEITKMITKKTKGILICTPNNPTGTIYTEEEMRTIVDVSLEYDLWVLSDEVYREFTFDGRKHTGILEFTEISERAVMLDSISKRFSACGARIGYIVTRNRDLWNTILKFGQARLCPPTVEQLGAIAGFKNRKKFMPSMIKEYQERRDIVFDYIQKIEGAFTLKPEGAFYTVVKLPVKNSENFIKWMLTDFNVDKKTTMLSPANGFYATSGKGEDEVRIAYVLNNEALEDAMRILQAGLKEYAKIEG